MITRNRINISEKQAALIWQQAAGTKLTSTDGQKFHVIYPGRMNGDTGPDFRDAAIANKSRLIKGDIEVHVRSSDWYRHGHDADVEYNNVILHVVMWPDCNSATVLQSGTEIPVLCLAQALPHQAYLLPHTLPCFSILDHIDRHALKKILDTAGEQKFRQKATRFLADILDRAPGMSAIGQMAGQVLLRGMMRALGYAKNTKPFEGLADRMPLTSVESQEGLAAKQALLLGTAGLLPSQRRQIGTVKEREIQELEQIWRCTGGNLKTMEESDWHLSRIYPNNSPVRRIVAQSYLLERYTRGKLLVGILQTVADAPPSGGHRLLQNGLTVDSTGYWRDHFDFGARSRTKISALLGLSKAGEVAVNVILPFAFSWGELTHDADLADHALQLYRCYPGLPENCLTRHMAKQLRLEEVSDFTSCQQQGLIHIFRSYCREGRCSECALAGRRTRAE